jgi:hypothetical protein
MSAIRNYMSILLLFFSLPLAAQDFLPQGQIGSFKNANSFTITPSGFIFVTDKDQNEITKLDTLGNVIKTIGGYGWDESLFDEPADIFTNTLNVWIADKNNHRIQIFDKDLNYLSSIKSNENASSESFRYPTGIAVSEQGELFILDSDNTRILKYNIRGEFQLQIGSFESGNFALNNPKTFSIVGRQKIFVTDSKELIVFDLFGNGISKINLEYEPQNINCTPNFITITDGTNIYYAVLSAPDLPISFNSFSPQANMEIRDAFISNKKLFILTPTAILKYQFNQESR